MKNLSGMLMLPIAIVVIAIMYTTAQIKYFLGWEK